MINKMDKNKITVIIDNGHGADTPGKCSPDGRLKEYAYCREIARKIHDALKSMGYKSHLLVTEESDIKLSTRVKRANDIYASLKTNGETAILISVHNNAAANGQWTTARGWTVWVARECSSKSKVLAQTLYSECEKRGLKGNRCVPAERYWTCGFYILKNTKMPAVLTENLFQDNREDVAYLLSDKGMSTIVDLHVAGIKRYIDSL